MRIWLAKLTATFVPADEDAERVFKSMKIGECAQFEVIRPRSVQWHRMYFGICKTIGDNQDPPRDADSIDHELRVRAGHFDVYLIDGHEVRVPKRIAFARMDANDWSVLWPSLELAIREHFGEEYVREALNATG